MRPALLLVGSPLEIAQAFLACAAGLIALSMAYEGYGWGRLNLMERLLPLLAGVGLLVPNLLSNAAGGALFVISISLQVIKNRQRALVAGKTAKIV